MVDIQIYFIRINKPHFTRSYHCFSRLEIQLKYVVIPSQERNYGNMHVYVHVHEGEYGKIYVGIPYAIYSWGKS